MSKMKEYYHDIMEANMRPLKAKTKGVFIRINSDLLVKLDLSSSTLGITTNELLRYLIVKHLKDYDRD